MARFWSMARNDGRTDLYLLDDIAGRQSWFSDSVTPKSFKRDLDAAAGDLYVWIDSPGGDAFAGATIHDMLREYSASGRGRVIAMVSLAASAASIIAMAADEIRISILGTMMIHEPWSQPTGNSTQLRAVANVLDEIRDGQVDAYVRRTGQSRERILEMLKGPDGNGTYMNATDAIAWGFADGLMHEDEEPGAKGIQMLARTRIASSIERGDERMREIAVKIGESAVPKSIMDMQTLVDAVSKMSPRLGEAFVEGVRCGLRKYDELMSGGPEDPEEPEETDMSLDALLSAIRSIEND